MVCERIRKLREDKGASIEEIARILRCPEDTYCKIEQGQAPIPTEVILRLAHFYKVSVNYILGIEDDE